MKTQLITFGLLIAALTVTSCKNNEALAPETQATIAPTAVDTTMQKTATTVIDSIKPSEKGENEANEKTKRIIITLKK